MNPSVEVRASADQTLTLRSPAKINLGLRIGRRRDDGFHEIDTIFQTVSLSDLLTLEFSAGQQDQLEIIGPRSFPVEPSNLILRALEELRSYQIEFPPVNIKLEKNIPLGSGMGGGSSNAASILQAACEINGRELSEPVFHEIAAGLGADVPFFLSGGTARGQGKGEELESMPDLDGWALIVVPPDSIDTEWAYSNVAKHLKKDGSGNKIPFSQFSSGESTAWKSMPLANDFQPLLENEFGTIRKVVSLLEQESSSVGVSGSGSTVYALFENKAEATISRDTVREALPEGHLVFLEQFVGSQSIPWFGEE